MDFLYFEIEMVIEYFSVQIQEVNATFCLKFHGKLSVYVDIV